MGELPLPSLSSLEFCSETRRQFRPQRLQVVVGVCVGGEGRGGIERGPKAGWEVRRVCVGSPKGWREGSVSKCPEGAQRLNLGGPPHVAFFFCPPDPSGFDPVAHVASQAYFSSMGHGTWLLWSHQLPRWDPETPEAETTRLDSSHAGSESARDSATSFAEKPTNELWMCVSIWDIHSSRTGRCASCLSICANLEKNQ